MNKFWGLPICVRTGIGGGRWGIRRFKTWCTTLLYTLALAALPGACRISAQAVAQTYPPFDHDHGARQWLDGLDVVPGAWQAVETLNWFGRSLWLRQFSLSQEGLDEAALRFTQAAPALDRVLTGSGMLLLSGTQSGLHLVVQVQRSARGISGFASVLELAVTARETVADVVDPALAWLTQDTQVHASQWSLPDGGQVRQFLHAVAQPVAGVRERLRIALMRHGWNETVAGVEDTQWQRGGDRLYLLPDRSGQGSLLYQMLRVGEP